MRLSGRSTSRRGFLAQSACVAAWAASGSWAVAAPDAASWACPVLGDIHFDRLEHHDFEWLEKTHPGDLRQVQNYSRLTREIVPKLLAVMKQQVDSSPGPVPWVLQLGDLIEGLCGTPELATRQAREAIALVKECNFGRPLILTKGNHDITGPGATEAFNELLVPFMADPALEPIHRAAFTQSRGGTLLVFYDAYDPKSLDWFAAVLQERRPERLIVVIHPPVVPYNARSTWHIYSRPNQQPQRERLLNLLGRHHAIVLCGHLHKYCFLKRRTEHGSFVQLAISSVATDAEGKPRDELTGVSEYGPDLVRLEPNHSPETIETRRANLAAEKPFIEHFEYADVWGHGMLHCESGRIKADIYRGLDTTAWKSLELNVG
jgi:hypothetical protein